MATMNGASLHQSPHHHQQQQQGQQSSSPSSSSSRQQQQPFEAVAPSASQVPDLERRPTWAKFDFDSGFDLKAGSEPLFPGFREQARDAQPATNQSAKVPRSQTRWSPNAPGDVPPLPSHFNTLVQHHSGSPRSSTPISPGSSKPSSPFGIPVTSLTNEDWSKTPTLEPEFADIDETPVQPASTRNRFPSSKGSPITTSPSESSLPRPNGAHSSRAGNALQQVTGQNLRSLDAGSFAPSRARPSSQAELQANGVLTSSGSQNTILGSESPVTASQKSTPRAQTRATMTSLVQSTPPQSERHQSMIDASATPRQSNHVAGWPTSSQPQTNGISAWDRQFAPAMQHFSSADAYTQPMEILNSGSLEPSTRPGTALSQLSGDGWMHDGTGNRSSYGTTYSSMASPFAAPGAPATGANSPAVVGAGVNTAKRASVLSFQTAISGGGLDGFTSGDEGRASSRDEDFEEAVEIPPRRGELGERQPQPWLSNGYGSSPDERSIPGALPGSFTWDEPVSRFGSRPESFSSAPRSPGQMPVTLPPSSATKNKALPPQPLRTDSIGLAPTSTQNTIKSPALSVPASSTAGASSDDATQRGVHSPGSERNQILGIPRPSEAQGVDGKPKTNLLGPQTLDSPGSAAPGLPSKSEQGETQTVLSDNVIPPPLPAEVAATRKNIEPPTTFNPTMDQKPVSDFRRKPLANISPEQQAAGLAQLKALNDPSRSSDITASPVEIPTVSVNDGPARRASATSLTAALVQPPATKASTGQLLDRPASPSLETPSREPSPPPDGEVEARAEWERTQMQRRQKQMRDSASKSGKGSGTFRGQLKPLQLVPADDVSATEERSVPQAKSPGSPAIPVKLPTTSGEPAGRTASASDAVSTQQLQRIQAREQRRSVGAFSATIGAANMASSNSNGPYPVFTSPSGGGAKKTGSRQYPGLMPQLSLVPPFELQNRPDGLPSGLIGPDGVRRSINDPEVCLECMMRDEDMIDVHVVGEGLWERESDKEFEEAVRIEAEEEAKQRAAHEDGVGSIHEQSSAHGSSAHRHGSTEGGVRARPHKRIGKGEPLTVERLKLHTQMNPPASSHRWRTLQTFLAVQAKYIAMEQQRLKMEADRRRSAMTSSRTSTTDSSASNITGPAPGSVPGRPVVAPVPVAGSMARETNNVIRSRNSSASMLKNSVAVDDDVNLTPAEREEKERDIALARAARSRLTGATSPDIASKLNKAVPAVPVVPLKAQGLQPGSDDERRRFSTPLASPLDSGNQVGAPRRSVAAIPMTPGRTNSSQDIRGAMAGGLASPTVTVPASPAESLAPPSRPFAPASPSAGSRMASRSGASQLSLMHSGSMVDMHLDLEDRNEHRINQTGFIPGTPMNMESPGTMSRAYYGFPGDGDVPAPDVAAQQVALGPGEGYMDPDRAKPEGMRSASIGRDESLKKKKRGLRGLFSKLTGNSNNGSVGSAPAESVNGSISSRKLSQRSRSSSSPRITQSALLQGSENEPLPQPPLPQQQGASGFLGRARKSTTSLFSPQLGSEAESLQRVRPSAQSSLPFQSPPGMASQASIDLGPFQPSSPGGNSATSGKRTASEGQKTRQSSNSLMQKYLSSPVAGTQSSQFTSAPPSRSESATNVSFDAKGSRISSFASSKDLRSPTMLQTIPDGGRASMDVRSSVVTSTGEERADQNSVSSISRSSLRKELPPMPADLVAESATGPKTPSKHVRSGSSGPIPAGRISVSGSMGTLAPSPPNAGSIGRRSMQATRPPMPFITPPMPSQQQSITGKNGLGLGSPSIDSVGQGPKRPPRHPMRPDQSWNGSEADLLSASWSNKQASFGQVMQTDFPMEAPDELPPRAQTSMDFTEKRDAGQRKSKLLRLPFGRKKRESTLGTGKYAGGGIENIAGPSQTTIGLGPPPTLRNRSSYSGLVPPKASLQLERQRVLSSPTDDRPPRSQSAFGMLSTSRFASSSRLSRDGRLVGSYEEEDEEEDEEDGMDMDQNYQPMQMMASEIRGPNGREASGGSTSFGRKSLNLLREGFRRPLRQESGDANRKRF